ncbi:MAG TPA: hypothetical protein PK948_12490 [Gemmatimonadales bacterium]|nr:hypothetical protein [Gemmatimonadales bacterium]
MFAPLIATAALAGGIATSTPTPAPVSPVTTLKYKVSLAINSVVDLSVFGAGEQKTIVAMSGYFTMTLKDTTGGRALTAVLDSVHVDSASQGQELIQAAVDSSKGSTWHGLVTPRGKIEGLTLATGGSGARQFESVLAGFFPSGSAATRKKGETWVDTLSYTSTSDEGTSAANVVTTYTAAGEGAYGTGKALVLNTTSVTTSSSSQTGPQGEVAVEGAGRGVGTHYVAKDGTYLGGNSTLDSDLQITVTQAPAPFPGKLHTVITIASL